jgi:hypothetical protein
MIGRMNAQTSKCPPAELFKGATPVSHINFIPLGTISSYPSFCGRLSTNINVILLGSLTRAVSAKLLFPFSPPGDSIRHQHHAGANQ